MTDRDTKLRAVAQRFLGWEPGKMCTEVPTSHLHPDNIKIAASHLPHCAHGNVQPHEILPPDPAVPTVAWALLEAIWEDRSGPPDDCTWDGNGALADALLDAAYQLTLEEKENG